MRKLTTIGIIALLLISLIPSALAANAREKATEQIKEKHEKAVEKYRTAKQEIKTEAKLQQIRQDKQQRHETLNKQLEERKDKIKETCKDEKSQECQRTKTELRQVKKERLENYSERVANGLETAIDKISKLNINETKKQELIQKLTENRQKILGLKDVVEEQTEETENETKELVQKEAKKALNEMRRAATMSNLKRFNGALEKAENLQKKLENIIERAQKAGKDISELEALKSEFDDKISLAKEKHQKALDLAQDMTKENMKEAINLVKEAHQTLKEAHQVLKEIAKKLREQKTQGNQTE